MIYHCSIRHCFNLVDIGCRPDKGRGAQLLPTPNANGRCPTTRVPAPMAGPVPGGATAPTPAIGSCWDGCASSAGSARPLPPDVTSRQRPQTFRELVTDLYVHGVSFRGLSRLLALLGCGVGAATLWRDVQAVAPGLAPDPQAALPSWVEVDETWLPLGGVKRPVAVVLGPQGERLDLRLSGPGLDGAGWFTVLAQRGVRGLTTDDDPVYGPALETAGLDRQPCAVHMQRTVGRHIRGLDEDNLTHLDRVLLPILRRLARERPPEAGPVLLALWKAVMQGRVRLQPEVRKLLWHSWSAGTTWCAAKATPRCLPPPTGWRAGLAAASPGPA